MRTGNSNDDVSTTQASPNDLRTDISKRLRAGRPTSRSGWALHGLDRSTARTTIEHKWIVLNTESLMEGLHDLLDSRLIYLDDQLELVVMGWCYYHQYGDDLPQYLYSDVYDLIGTAVESTYESYPEYSVEMARSEARRVVDSIVGKMVTAMEPLQPQLNDVILPALARDEEGEAYIGGVTLVGGDMAVRIDYVRHESVNDPLGGGVA